MRIKSIVSESKQIQRAIALIKLGARLQVLESETDLSYERLLRLYKEVQGESPARGMLPFSTDWFMTWQPNIHSSLFLNMYEYLDKTSELEEIDAIIKAYELYLEQIRAQGLEPLLSVTRAWRLVKFVDAGMVTLTPCCKCGGKFVTHTFELTKNYVCGLCEPRHARARARPRCRRASKKHCTDQNLIAPGSPGATGDRRAHRPSASGSPFLRTSARTSGPLFLRVAPHLLRLAGPAASGRRVGASDATTSFPDRQRHVEAGSPSVWLPGRARLKCGSEVRDALPRD